jgi:16S rRNA (adenine1518-N6/adenine1519-N6)-dimethyltransferase
MMEIADVRRNERVLEIGPGRGSLTFELSKHTDRMEAYEIDRQNYLLLRNKLNDRVSLYLGDAFKVEPEFDVLVSSLPYSMSSTFVGWLSKRDYDRAVVVLQEEFVRKITSPPGTKDYRAVSVISQISSSVEIMETVKRSSFDPQPRVNSLLVMIRPRKRLDDESISMIKRLFSLRRRRLAAVMKEFGLKTDTHWREERIQSIPPEEVYGITSRLLGR